MAINFAFWFNTVQKLDAAMLVNNTEVFQLSDLFTKKLTFYFQLDIGRLYCSRIVKKNEAMLIILTLVVWLDNLDHALFGGSWEGGKSTKTPIVIDENPKTHLLGW